MVQEGVEEEDYLRKGRAAPDLDTVKDLIRYYIDSSTGMLSANLVCLIGLEFCREVLWWHRPCDGESVRREW